jgi:YD repeat-containing protein
VTVVAPTLTVTPVQFNPTAGEPFSGEVAQISDSIPAPDGGFGYTVAWGDGWTTTQFVGTSASTYNINESHTYTSAGTYTVTVSGSDNVGGYDSKSFTITVAPEPTPEPDSECPTGFATDDGGDNPENPSNTSPSDTQYGTGTNDADPSDFGSAGFGMNWGEDIGWTNVPIYSSGGTNGSGFVNADQPFIQTTSTGYRVVTTATNILWFDSNGSGGYTPKFYSQDVFAADGSAGDFKLTDTLGDVIRFYGFESSVPVAQRGKFKSYTDPNGNVTSTTYNSSGQLTSVQRSDGTTTETFAYTYLSSGINAGLMSSCALQRTIGGVTTTVRQVVYSYYDGTQPYGNPGELELEQVEDGSNNVLDTTYYRYYTAADIAAGGNGYLGALKYVFHPQSYARLVAAVSNPQTASDSSVAPYADDYYEYDSSMRVTKAVVQGAGCSCAGSTNQGTFTYSYTTSTNTAGYNSWATKTVETLPDGNENIVYTNFAGEVMLSALYDISDEGDSANDGKVWATYYRYDSQGRLLLTAEPSAVTIQNTTTLASAASSYADIVGYNAGTSTYQYLSSSSGVIDLIDYGTSTTATSSTAGDVAGYMKDHKVENGYAGTPILLDSTQYISHTDSNSITVYVVANSSVYRNTNGTGAETTSYAYTWYSGTNEVDSTAVSAPTVSSGQNGPGTADVATVVYDTYGRPTWTKDADGFINYYAYDNATGAVVKSIVDVDTTQSTEFSNLPSGWSTPTGGGLNLVTTDQVDALGRTTKEVDPNGNVTYIVYDDPDHEVRVYAGWNATTGTTTGPIGVYREDRAGSYTETLTMSATPAVSGSSGSYVPTGTEAISNIQTLSRTYTDKGGRTIEVDDYYNLSGVTYSTSAHIGTLGTNYYATYYGYNDRGWLAHVEDANGTITDLLYDALGRVVSTYVGTLDTDFWTGGPNSNMTLVSQNQYDGHGIGDSNLTQTTAFPDSTSGDNRVTQYAYDWRDRLVALKSGVQSSEDTTTHRPIIYYDLDNLGEVTDVSQFDGDTVSLSSSKPSSSLLRSYVVYSDDDQGRVYQVQQYSVNQSTGSVSTDALTTNDWYDHRGDLAAESDPGGLVTKIQYDGAGRPTSTSETDGAGGSAWSNASSLTGDHVLTQTFITYDADGNPILVVNKQRFNTDASSDTGALGGPSTGPKARVYYTAYYYDALNRLTAAVDVGTNGGSAYTRPSSAPSRSDTVLVTSDTYNAAGWVQDVTDPRGIVTRTIYDALGRPTQTIAAYDATINSGQPTDSANQTTDYTYDGNGDITSITAVMPLGTPSQTTAYIYGVTTSGGSAIDSNDLLGIVEYPDPTSGAASTSTSNRAFYQYNALGQPISLSDPDGSTHTYTYDVLGRVISDAVTTLGSGVDGAVLRLTTAYDTGGRPYLFTSYNAASGGSIVNQVEDLFNGLGQLTTEYQESGGAVNTSTSPKVQYAYTEMSGGQNNSRPVSMTYPNGRVLDYVYNSGLDSAVSRISALADDSGGSPSTTLESYGYLGLGTIVVRTRPEAGIALTYLHQTGDSHANTDAGDQYTGLDRFGRVIDEN